MTGQDDDDEDGSPPNVEQEVVSANQNITSRSSLRNDDSSTNVNIEVIDVNNKSNSNLAKGSHPGIILSCDIPELDVETRTPLLESNQPNQSTAFVCDPESDSGDEKRALVVLESPLLPSALMKKAAVTLSDGERVLDKKQKRVPSFVTPDEDGSPQKPGVVFCTTEEGRKQSLSSTTVDKKNRKKSTFAEDPITSVLYPEDDKREKIRSSSTFAIDLISETKLRKTSKKDPEDTANPSRSKSTFAVDEIQTSPGQQGHGDTGSVSTTASCISMSRIQTKNSTDFRKWTVTTAKSSIASGEWSERSSVASNRKESLFAPEPLNGKLSIAETNADLQSWTSETDSRSATIGSETNLSNKIPANSVRRRSPKELKSALRWISPSVVINNKHHIPHKCSSLWTSPPLDILLIGENVLWCMAHPCCRSWLLQIAPKEEPEEEQLVFKENKSCRSLPQSTRSGGTARTAAYIGSTLTSVLKRTITLSPGFVPISGLQPKTVYTIILYNKEGVDDDKIITVHIKTSSKLTIHRLCGLGQTFARINWIDDDDLLRTDLDEKSDMLSSDECTSVSSQISTTNEFDDTLAARQEPEEIILTGSEQSDVEVLLAGVEKWGEGDNWRIVPNSELFITSSSTPIVLYSLKQSHEYIIKIRRKMVLPHDISLISGCDVACGVWSRWTSFVTRSSLEVRIIHRNHESLVIGWNRPVTEPTITPSHWRASIPHSDVGVTHYKIKVTACWNDNETMRKRLEAELRELEEIVLQEEYSDSDSEDAAATSEKTQRQQQRVDQLCVLQKKLGTRRRSSARSEVTDSTFFTETISVPHSKNMEVIHLLESSISYRCSLQCYCGEKTTSEAIKVMGKTTAASRGKTPKKNPSHAELVELYEKNFGLSLGVSTSESVLDDNVEQSKPSDENLKEPSEEISKQEVCEDEIDDPHASFINPAMFISILSVSENKIHISWSNFDPDLETFYLTMLKTEHESQHSKWSSLLRGLDDQRKHLMTLKSRCIKIKYKIRIYKLLPGESSIPDPIIDESREQIIDLMTTSFETSTDLETNSLYGLQICCKKPGCGWTAYSRVVITATASAPKISVTRLQTKAANLSEFTILPKETTLEIFQRETAQTRKTKYMPGHSFECFTDVSYHIRLQGGSSQQQMIHKSKSEMIPEVGFVILNPFQIGTLVSITVRVCLPSTHTIQEGIDNDKNPLQYGSWSECHYITQRHVGLEISNIGNGTIQVQWKASEESTRKSESVPGALSTSILSVKSASKKTLVESSWTVQKLSSYQFENLPYDRYQILLIVSEYFSTNNTAADSSLELNWSESFAAVALVRTFYPLVSNVGEDYVEIHCILPDGEEEVPTSVDEVTSEQVAVIMSKIASLKTSTGGLEKRTAAKDIIQFEVSVVENLFNGRDVRSSFAADENDGNGNIDGLVRTFAPTSNLSGIIYDLLPDKEYTITIRPQLVSGTSSHWGQWSKEVRFKTLSKIQLQLNTVTEDSIEVCWCRPYPIYRHGVSEEDHRRRYLTGNHSTGSPLQLNDPKSPISPKSPSDLLTASVVDSPFGRSETHEYSYLDLIYSTVGLYEISLVLDPHSSVPDSKKREVEKKMISFSQHITTFTNLLSGVRYRIKARQIAKSKGDKVFGMYSNSLAVWTSPSLQVQLNDVCEDTIRVLHTKGMPIINTLEKMDPTKHENNETVKVLHMDDDAVTCIQMRVIPGIQIGKKYVLQNPLIPSREAAENQLRTRGKDEMERLWRERCEFLQLTTTHQSMLSNDSNQVISATNTTAIVRNGIASRLVDYYKLSDFDEIANPQSLSPVPPVYENSCDLSKVPIEGGRCGIDPSFIINFKPNSDSSYEITGMQPSTQYGITARVRISDSNNGNWSDIKQCVTQSPITVSLNLVGESYSIISWKRKSEKLISDAPEYSTQPQVASWQIELNGYVPYTGPIDDDCLSLPNHPGQHWKVQPKTMSVPARLYSHRLLKLVPEQDYSCKIRAFLQGMYQKKWSRWSEEITFRTKPPLVVTIEEVGRSYCVLNCERMKDNGMHVVTDEEYEIRCFSSTDEKWVQSQTSAAPIPTESTSPIVVTAGFDNIIFIKNLSPGKHFTAIARVATESSYLYDCSQDWSTTVSFTTRPQIQASLKCSDEKYAVIEILPQEDSTAAIQSKKQPSQPKDHHQKYRLSLNGRLLVDSFVVLNELATVIRIDGLQLHNKYVVRCAEAVPELKYGEYGWGTYENLISIETTPQRPTIPILYEHKEGSCVSFFWRLEQPGDLAELRPASRRILKHDDNEADGRQSPDSQFEEQLDRYYDDHSSDISETQLYDPVKGFYDTTVYGRNRDRYLSAVFDSQLTREGNEINNEMEFEDLTDIVVSYEANDQIVDEVGVPLNEGEHELKSGKLKFSIEAARILRNRHSPDVDEKNVHLSEFITISTVSTSFFRAKLFLPLSEYCFRMKTVGNSNSKLSPIFSFKIPEAPPAPIRLTISDVQHSSVLVKWDVLPELRYHNQVYYSIWLSKCESRTPSPAGRRISDDDNWFEFARVRVTGVFVTNLFIGTPYRLFIRSHSTFGKSLKSNIIWFSTLQKVEQSYSHGFVSCREKLNDPRALWKPSDYNWVYPNPTSTDSTPIPFPTVFHLYKNGVILKNSVLDQLRWEQTAILPPFAVSFTSQNRPCEVFNKSCNFINPVDGVTQRPRSESAASRKISRIPTPPTSFSGSRSKRISILRPSSAAR